MTTAKVTVKTFIEQVKALEGITLQVWSDEDTLVDAYDFTERAPDQMTVAEWMHSRIQPKIGDTPVDALDNLGDITHHNRHLDSVRHV